MEPNQVAAALYDVAYRTREQLMVLAGDVGSATEKLQAIHEVIRRYEEAGMTAGGLTKAIREIIGPDKREPMPMAALSFMSVSRAGIRDSTSV